MPSDIQRPDSSLVRVPRKETPMASPSDTELLRCASCQSVMSSDAENCLACGTYLPVIQSFIANTTTITLDEPVRLSWEVDHADRVWLEGEEEELLPLVGQEIKYPRSNGSYVLVAQSASGTCRATVDLYLPAPDIRRFEVDQRQIDIGFPVIFSWEASNAEIVRIEPQVGEVSGLSFCEVYLSQPGVYELRVSNDSGEARAKVFLSLPKPEIRLFQAAQDLVEPGEAHLLYWEVDNVEKLILQPDGLDVTGLTQVEVFPDRSTTYRLEARNSSGSVEETLFLPMPAPEIKDFSSPEPIATEGGPVLLRWQVKYAYRVELEPGFGEVPATGEVKYRPKHAFTEFRLRAIGHSGVQTAFLTISRFPLPLEDVKEDQLFRDLHKNLREQEKWVRAQQDQFLSARSLPNAYKPEPQTEEEALEPGSITREFKRFFRRLRGDQ